MKKKTNKRRMYKDYLKNYYIDDHSLRYSIINRNNLDKKDLIIIAKFSFGLFLLIFVLKYLFF